MNTAGVIYTAESDAVRVPMFKRKEITQWVHDVADLYDRSVGEITYIFCDDSFIKRLNKKELNHDYATDILTFDNCVGDLLFADIVISVDTVKENALEYKQEPERELFRVMIHGVLHLCGLTDGTPEEQAEMRQAEDEALAMLPENLMDLWRSGAKRF